MRQKILSLHVKQSTQKNPIPFKPTLPVQQAKLDLTIEAGVQPGIKEA